MPVQSALAQVGVAKQTSKGSAASNPTFAHGLTDGAVLSVDITQDADERTSGSLGYSDVNRTAVVPGASFSGRAHPKTTGLYLFGALGGKSVTGAGPYTHVFTPADTLPYLTLFGKLDATLTKVQDYKVDNLTLSFSENEPLSVEVEGMGTALSFGTFVPGTDETAATYFTAASGTFKLDVDSGTAVTARVTAGEVAIANALEAIMASGSVAPNDMFNAQREVTCSFDIVPDNLEDWRTIVTGSASGSGITASPVLGSFEIEFTEGTNVLTLAATRVSFVTDFPDADPAGGPVTLTLAGIVLKPSGGNQITATLVNAQASY
jgi:hypothetical protein